MHPSNKQKQAAQNNNFAQQQLCPRPPQMFGRKGTSPPEEDAPRQEVLRAAARWLQSHTQRIDSKLPQLAPVRPRMRRFTPARLLRVIELAAHQSVTGPALPAAGRMRRFLSHILSLYIYIYIYHIRMSSRETKTVPTLWRQL